MQLVVLLVVKIRTHFGVLLPSALLDCLKINHDMLWYYMPQVRTYCLLEVSMLFQILCSACIRSVLVSIMWRVHVLLFLVNFTALLICRVLAIHWIL